MSEIFDAINNVDIRWFRLIIVVVLLAMLTANVMLINANFRENKSRVSTKKDYIKAPIIYGLISLFEATLAFFLNYLIYHSPLTTIFKFVEDVLNDALNRLPLSFIILWFAVPLIILYIYYLTTGLIYYHKKKKAYYDRLKPKKDENIDYEALITVKDIATPKDFRNFIKRAREEVQYAKIQDEIWIAIDNHTQLNTLGSDIGKVADGHDFPVIVKSQKGKDWEVLTVNDGLKIIRKLKSR